MDRRIRDLRFLARRLGPRKEYHNSTHMDEVALIAEVLACRENVPFRDRLLVTAAGQVHDLVHEEGRNDNEEMTVRRVFPYLLQFGFSKGETKTISSLILATKQGVDPKNLLERIIKDADLAYLGMPDAFIRSDRLRKEHGIDELAWYTKVQLEFLRQFSFYTDAAQELYGMTFELNREQAELRAVQWRTKI